MLDNIHDSRSASFACVISSCVSTGLQRGELTGAEKHLNGGGEGKILQLTYRSLECGSTKAPL